MKQYIADSSLSSKETVTLFWKRDDCEENKKQVAILTVAEWPNSVVKY